MFARISTFKGGSERLEEGVELFRDKVVPEDEKQPGFAGAFLLADREADLAYAVTLWESEEALHATDALGKQLASSAAEQLGLDVSVASAEVPFFKVATPVA